MTYRPPFVSDAFVLLEPPHPATLEEADLLRQCKIEYGRVGGPGGQHRNRNDTATWIVHLPSHIEAQATERRSQAQNRHEAIKRLRRKLAVRARTVTSRDHHQVSELWSRRRQGEKMSVNPDHSDYPALLAEALDVVVARRFDVAGAAGVLGITMSQLTRLIRHEKHAFAMLNSGRQSVGLPPLRS
ncbi:MAG: peptide chain release factor-like protein [Phycisphaeraceae bacterium]|nr:peptide chain release factor-like protein [Phycisphaeraceae bacterium]